MPTLLQIGASCNWGAPGKIAEQIGLQAQSRGWDCYIAHGARFFNPTQLKSIPVVNSFQEKLHYLKSMLFDAQGLASTSETKVFLKKAAQIKPDVIHLHNLHGYFINYKYLFKYIQEENIPVVWTFHDCWPITGHCCYFDSFNCEKWKNECNNCSLSKAYPKSLFFDRSRSNFLLKKELFTSIKKMSIVPVSIWLGDIISQSFLNKYPISVIHNGIDIETFKPFGSYERSPKKKILGVASPWSKRKGLEDFIALSKNSDYQITLVGIDDELRKTLPSNIIAIKRTNNQQELAKIYSEADVFVNPTYSDNFPTTNIEALACGTPVITYETGGSPEALNDETGIVVPKGNLTLLKNAIDIVCGKGKDEYVLKCRQRALNLFDKNKVYEKYVSIYESFL